MSVNQEVIKQLRNNRGWTQQHLADACDLSLRTIQRVEKLGTASKETRAALAAVFEVEQQDISIIPQVNKAEMKPVELKYYQLSLLLVLFIGSLLGAGLMYLFIR